MAGNQIQDDYITRGQKSRAGVELVAALFVPPPGPGLVMDLRPGCLPPAPAASLVLSGITQHFPPSFSLCGVAGAVDHYPGAIPPDPTDGERCPDRVFLHGKCVDHENERMVVYGCKRRFCPVCGPRRRYKIAARIALGVAQFGGAAWFVGTFDRDVTRAEANLVVQKFIRWLRKKAGQDAQYVTTWEITQKLRLHVNIVFGRWLYVHQSVLSRKWARFGGGCRVWIQEVKGSVGVEMTKAKSMRAMSNYVTKFEQMVREGRTVTFSKGWPKLPEPEKLERKGMVFFAVATPEHESFRIFHDEASRGYWKEIRPGEWARPGETCDCFELRGPPGDEGGGSCHGKSSK